MSTVLSLSQSVDQKRDILLALGDLSGIQVTRDEVLVATYIEPEKTAGGIIKPGKRLDESIYQGKVGLVLKMGPTAFKFERIVEVEEPVSKEKFTVMRYLDFPDPVPQIGDWVAYFPNEGRGLRVRNIECRLLPADSINMIVDDPNLIY